MYQIEEVDNKNWKLICFRLIILLNVIVCLICNITDIVHHAQIIYCYWDYTGAEFIKFEVAVLITNIGMIPILIIGTLLVFKQNIKQLRSYLTILFLLSWLQMLLIIALTQRFPLTHIVHSKWMDQKSIAKYESQYNCCGRFGPDDYILRTGRVPNSCLVDTTNSESREIHTTGCLAKDDVDADIISYELITSLFQLILVFLMVCHYFYLKRIKAENRSFRGLWRDHIFL
ncbi:23 kDa integral membrane protein isoform X2 [Drosophila grimshawi]|uniref:23 kDa integral membrane protein isoform X2 n=1 Tax=Drosophila grimshawi TaxID=7222 RepID=UPI000C86FE18|nr:23 kDa integral membrane protein isoform X2 [Drosophila grimshawi]